MGSVIDLILTIVFIATVFAGIKNGFVRTVLSFVAVAIAFAAALWLSTPIANAVYDSFLSDEIESAIAAQLPDVGSAQLTALNTREILAAIPEQISSVAEKIGIDIEELAHQMESVNFTPSSVASQISYSIARPVAECVLKALAFAAVFLLLNVILQIAVGIISKFFKLPVLKTFNRALGGALGAVKGIIVVATLVVLLGGLSEVMQQGELTQAVGESKIIDIIASTEFFSRLSLA